MCPIISAAELGEDYSQKAVPEGSWDLRVRDAKFAVSAAGNPGMTLFITIEGAAEFDPPDIVAWFGEPIRNTKDYKRYMRQLTELMRAVNWKGDFDMSTQSNELIGSAFNYALKQETDRRDGKTIVNRLALPR